VILRFLLSWAKYEEHVFDESDQIRVALLNRVRVWKEKDFSLSIFIVWLKLNVLRVECWVSKYTFYQILMLSVLHMLVAFSHISLRFVFFLLYCKKLGFFQLRKKEKSYDCHTVGNFRIAGGHVIFVVGNGFQLLRSDYISLRKPSLRK